VVVLGAGATAIQVIGALQRWPSRGLRPVLVLDDDEKRHGQLINGLEIAGPIESVANAAAEAGITAVLLAMPGAPVERVRTLWRILGQRFPTVLVVPGLGDFASLWVEAKDIGGQVALELQQSLLRPSRRLMKRTLDLILSSIVVVALAPLMGLLALLVFLTSPGPIFYGQRRLGRAGIPFTAWKFRTMRRDADAVLAEVLANDLLAKVEWERDHKLRRDPRITGIGRFLRSTSLDELPQVWNVLRGDMSLVGPRPVTAAEIPKYGDQWAIYTRVRPGITGQWQVSGRNHTTYDERVAWDAFYVHNWSPWLDIVILARTVQTVVRGEGAY
jgi:Undecaprenyl-phosphate galactose phosphotransferase WbaP